MRLRPLSIFSYGVLALVMGLAVLGGLSVLAVSQLRDLQQVSAQKHQDAAREEFHAAIAKLLAAADTLVDTFAAWDETQQQFNDPTYYDYWRQNRAPNANFIPGYFRQVELYGPDGKAMARPLDATLPTTIASRHQEAALVMSELGPVLSRCRPLTEKIGARHVLGYVCVSLDFIAGIKDVQDFHALDVDSIQIFGRLGERMAMDELLSRATFAAQSQPELAKMHELTLHTLGRFLLAGAVGMVVFFYLLIVPIGLPLRRLSQYIDALRTTGTHALGQQQPGVLCAAEVVKAFASLNDYEHRLEESAKALQESAEHFRSLIENASDVIAALDIHGNITYISPSVERMLGYPPRQMLGKPLVDFVHEEDRTTVARALQGFSTLPGALNIAEFRCRHQDGSWLTLEATGKILTGKHQGVIINWRDITERKRAQETIALARDQALKASTAKSHFLANTSHELRTPLNAILGYVEILREDVRERKTSNLLADLDRVHAAAEHLLKLINEILDLSKIEAEKMELELSRFEIQPLIREVCDTVRPLIRNNQNTLHIHCPEQIGEMCTDATKLRQIVSNLLSNAAKFTRYGNIHLDVMRREENGRGYIDIIVADTGIGIAEGQQDKIFTPFAQADSANMRRYEGTGLGLPLCRRFINLMGGKIMVNSTPGKGTTFTVSFPANVARPANETYSSPQVAVGAERPGVVRIGGKAD
jgi:PAS domain S-box-containing protein